MGRLWFESELHLRWVKPFGNGKIMLQQGLTVKADRPTVADFDTATVIGAVANVSSRIK